MNVKDVEFAVSFVDCLRRTMIEDETNLSDWNINIDKVIEHADKIKKLNPSNKYKFEMFLHEKSIITPTDQGKKKLEKLMNR